MLSKERAAEYFNRIGEGHRAAVRRPFDDKVDREFRRLIEQANRNGDCIISGDKGYYRPIPSDEVDALEFHKYMKQEHAKVESMRSKDSCMRVAYELRMLRE